MNKTRHLFLWGYLFFVANLPSLFAQDTCDHPDYPALVALYNATDGDNWTNSWDLSDCDVCAYQGITCNSANRVAAINLENNNLSGTLPIEIGLLDQLENLNLAQNALTGAIPKEIGKLNRLFVAFLENNAFTGNIPAEIGNLINTQFIRLDNNQLSGNLPAELKNFGSQRESLTMPGGINVANNQLSGCYPEGFGVFCVPNFSLITEGNTGLGDFTRYCESSQGICMETMSLITCDSLTFTSDIGKITVGNLSPQSKVEIIGRNTDYQVLTICDNDCPEMLTTPNLAEGDYTIKVNLALASGYCYREATLTVQAANNDNNGDINCDNLFFLGEEGQISIEGLTAAYNKVEILGSNTDWQVITICDGDCDSLQIIPDLQAGEYAVKVNQAGNDPDGQVGAYCYREATVMVTGATNSMGTANCETLFFERSNDTIIVQNLTAQYDKVEILGRNTNWQVLTICDGDCPDTLYIPNLQTGEYSVKVNQGGNDGSYCYREAIVVIENGSANRNSPLDFKDNLLLFPNPARDKIYLDIPSMIGKTGSIQIFNAFGQTIQFFPNTSLENSPISIDLDGYENGIYLLSLQIGSRNVLNKRFVVEHLR